MHNNCILGVEGFILKIAYLLAVGYGHAGTKIITNNFNQGDSEESDGSINVEIPGAMM